MLQPNIQMVYQGRLVFYGWRHRKSIIAPFTPWTQVDSIRQVEPEAHSYSNHQEIETVK